MKPHPDRILFRELPVVAKVIRDETWLEGERRGEPVSPDDPVVRENVCRVILRIGAELREACTREIGEDVESAA
jgi:hypothetical protein